MLHRYQCLTIPPSFQPTLVFLFHSALLDLGLPPCSPFPWTRCFFFLDSRVSCLIATSFRKVRSPYPFHLLRIRHRPRTLFPPPRIHTRCGNRSFSFYFPWVISCWSASPFPLTSGFPLSPRGKPRPRRFPSMFFFSPGVSVKPKPFASSLLIASFLFPQHRYDPKLTTVFPSLAVPGGSRRPARKPTSGLPLSKTRLFFLLSLSLPAVFPPIFSHNQRWNTPHCAAGYRRFDTQVSFFRPGARLPPPF